MKNSLKYIAPVTSHIRLFLFSLCFFSIATSAYATPQLPEVYFHSVSGGYPRLFNPDQTQTNSIDIFFSINDRFDVVNSLPNDWLEDEFLNRGGDEIPSLYDRGRLYDRQDWDPTTFGHLVSQAENIYYCACRLYLNQSTGFATYLPRLKDYLINYDFDMLSRDPFDLEYIPSVPTPYNENVSSYDPNIYDYNESTQTLTNFIEDYEEHLYYEADPHISAGMLERGRIFINLIRAYDLLKGLDEYYTNSLSEPNTIMNSSEQSLIEYNLWKYASKLFLQQLIRRGNYHAFFDYFYYHNPLSVDNGAIKAYTNHDSFLDAGLFYASIVLNDFDFESEVDPNQSDFYHNVANPYNWFRQSLGNLRAAYDGFEGQNWEIPTSDNTWRIGTLVAEDGAPSEGASYFHRTTLSLHMLPVYRAANNFLTLYNTIDNVPVRSTYHLEFSQWNGSISSTMRSTTYMTPFLGLKNSNEPEAWLEKCLDNLFYTQFPTGQLPMIEDSGFDKTFAEIFFVTDYDVDYGLYLEPFDEFDGESWYTNDFRRHSRYLTSQLINWQDNRFLSACLALPPSTFTGDYYIGVGGTLQQLPTAVDTRVYASSVGCDASILNFPDSSTPDPLGALFVHLTGDHGYNNDITDFSTATEPPEVPEITRGELSWHHEQDDNMSFELMKNGMLIVRDFGYPGSSKVEPNTSADTDDNAIRCNTIAWQNGEAGTITEGTTAIDPGITPFPRVAMTTSADEASSYNITHGPTSSYIRAQGSYKPAQVTDNVTIDRTIVAIDNNLVFHMDNLYTKGSSLDDSYIWSSLFSFDASLITNQNYFEAFSNNTGARMLFDNGNDRPVWDNFRLFCNWDRWSSDINSQFVSLFAVNRGFDNELSTDFTQYVQLRRTVEKHAETWSRDLLFTGVHIFQDPSDLQPIISREGTEQPPEGLFEGRGFHYRSGEGTGPDWDYHGRAIINRVHMDEQENSTNYHLFTYPGYSWTSPEWKIGLLETNCKFVIVHHYYIDDDEYVRIVYQEQPGTPVGCFETRIWYDYDFDDERDWITVGVDRTQDGEIHIVDFATEPTVSGVMQKSEKWHPSETHRVTGEILVPEYCRLTIEPGTRIHFEKEGRLRIEKGATLEILGTEENPIFVESEIADDLSTLIISEDKNDVKGSSSGINVVRVEGGSTANRLPDAYELSKIFPNPFNSEVTINYSVPRTSEINIGVYNVLGQEVATLINGEVQPGFGVVTWNGDTLKGQKAASGIYFISMEADGFASKQKVVLVH